MMLVFEMSGNTLPVRAGEGNAENATSNIKLQAKVA